MTPFKSWDKLIKKGGFGFNQKYPNTAYWRSLGLAGKPHLGKDLLTTVGEVGYAPFDGTITKHEGPQAGLQLVFQPYGEGYCLRFGHLKSILTTGFVKEGTPIMIAGNSGSATNTPHTHMDAQVGIKYDFGKLDIKYYFDPLTINWDKPMAAQIRIKIVANHWDAGKLSAQARQLKANLAAHNFLIQPTIDTEVSDFTDIPSENYGGTTYGPSRAWYKTNISPRAQGYDIVIFVVKPSEFPGLVGDHGYAYLDDGPLQETVVSADEDMTTSIPGVGVLPGLVYVAEHEIDHSLFQVTGQPDITHEYLNEGRFNEVLSKVDINKLIERTTMEFYQVQGESTVVVKIGGKYREIATPPELYPYVKATLGIPDALNPIGRSLVNANLGRPVSAGITF